MLSEVEELRRRAAAVQQRRENDLLRRVYETKISHDLQAVLAQVGQPQERSEGPLELDLQFNPNAKQLYKSAKLSEFQHRVNILEHCLSKWTSKSQPISALLVNLRRQIGFIDEKRLSYLYNIVQSVHN